MNLPIVWLLFIIRLVVILFLTLMFPPSQNLEAKSFHLKRVSLILCLAGAGIWV
jgi:membrane-bound acyltransferase YfiQ involved in biofilm formation